MQNLKTDWEAGKKRMTDRMKGVVVSPGVSKQTERELFRTIGRQRSSWLCDDLELLLRGEYSATQIKYTWLIDFLVASKLCPAELEALKRAVQYDAWAKIPVHAYHALLGARWEVDSLRGGTKLYSPNDEIDRMRAAVALSHAAIFITEGDLADLSKRARIRDFSDVLIFSVRDPGKILEHLKKFSS